MYFNGISGTTGRPLIQPMTPEELLDWIRKSDQDEDAALATAIATANEHRQEAREGRVLGLIEDVDPEDIEQARWGIIVHPETSHDVRHALADLLTARKGITIEYAPGETALTFRSRHQQGPGRVNPAKLPYYLLIVAPPNQIPYRFQYELDHEHAVGRLCFDTAADYKRYAERLLAYEQNTKPLARERRIAFFSPTNPDDEATALSDAELTAPLLKAFDGNPIKLPNNKGIISYQANAIRGTAATRSALVDLLKRQAKQPALIFSATHGVAYDNGHLKQRERQGALVCQNWPGPQQWSQNQPLPEDMFLAGDHLDSTLKLDGLVFFAFACYSAGTPRFEDFSHFKSQQPKELAPTPFVSRLAQRTLSQGALAFVGHVERAWSYSFLLTTGGSDIQTFRSTISAILKGLPIGYAFEHINDRYANLALDLTSYNEQSLLRQYNLGEPVELETLIEHWMAHNDARAYILFGDPYTHLRATDMPTAQD